MNNLAEAAEALEQFTTGNLRKRIASIEQDLRSSCQSDCKNYLAGNSITTDLLMAAKLLKQSAGQINTIIHAIAILLLLPELLKEGEKIEYLSLGAGNTGKSFDLETSHRIAEFKFIQWRGGSHDARRQDNLFQDFFNLAEHETNKLKNLFLSGVATPQTFLNGGRSIESVTKRNRALWERVTAKYSDQFRTVGEYYGFRQSEVLIVDVEPVLKRLASAGLL